METLNTKQIADINKIVFDQYDGIRSFYQRLAEISIAYSSMYMIIAESSSDNRGSVGDIHLLSELMQVFAKD